MVAFLEKHTGKKLDRERLRKIIETTEATRRKRWECYEARKAVPCPMPTGDMLSCLTPGLFLASRPEATKFFEDLYDELQERIRDKVGVVPNEKYRLLWGGGLPPWHNMGIFTYFEEKDAVFVIETAYMPFEPYDVKVKSDDPLELMVRTAYARNTERNRRAMLGCGDVATQNLLDLIRDYKVDGMVMHGSKSCRATTIGQTYYQNMVAEHVKIPTLFIESDIVDTRDYAEADMKMKIDAFIETLAAAKRNNGN
jgi:benzoyl-CoA reductase/2-hydroxyglutaryl-CoA dehydratase subunit BcrC/BadD/HgdB